LTDHNTVPSTEWQGRWRRLVVSRTGLVEGQEPAGHGEA